MKSEDAVISPRKKSPRAPSISLEDALARAKSIYDKERRHATPIDVAAQAIGYKNANNGAAMSAIASLRYYGLLERLQDGKVAVTKDVEDFIFAPSTAMEEQLLRKWARTPPLFAELLEKYPTSLPSEKTLRYELIQRGFNAASADSALSSFVRSIEFARYFAEGEVEARPSEPGRPGGAADLHATSVPVAQVDSHASELGGAEEPSESRLQSPQPLNPALLSDRIPVRLTGGRRAWLEIPTPFFAADKLRLKAQIDLLLTEDEESGDMG